MSVTTFGADRAARWKRVERDWEEWDDSSEAERTRTTLDFLSQDQEAFAAGWERGYTAGQAAEHERAERLGAWARDEQAKRETVEDQLVSAHSEIARLEALRPAGEPATEVAA